MVLFTMGKVEHKVEVSVESGLYHATNMFFIYIYLHSCIYTHTHKLFYILEFLKCMITDINIVVTNTFYVINIHWH